MNQLRELPSFQRQYLKGLAHPLKPVVQVGKEGLSSAVVAQLEAALLAHELIKVRLSRPPDKKALALAIAEAAGAHFYELIGHTVILYRPHPEQPRIALSERPAAGDTEG